jgi:hypothetical protein
MQIGIQLIQKGWYPLKNTDKILITEKKTRALKDLICRPDMIIVFLYQRAGKDSHYGIKNAIINGNTA